LTIGAHNSREIRKRIDDKTASEIMTTEVYTIGEDATVEEAVRIMAVSIGATLVDEGDRIDTLIKRADTLLYQSKMSGRNRLTSG
jgi:PleD family two-component response regulator